MKILYYGNCQPGGIKSLLRLKSDWIETQIVCYSTEISKEDFTNFIKESNVIIMQPIADNYRNKDYLSTNYVINNCNKDCKIIIFDSCYFNFYYFDYNYKIIDYTVSQNPLHYHHQSMIDSYINRKSVNYYIENYVENYDLKTTEELQKIADDSLNELFERYKNMLKYKTNNNIHIITIYHYLKKNYKDKLLFYSTNHPTKYIFHFLCEEIIKILALENNIDYNKDPLTNPKCILYNCIQKIVHFDIKEHKPNIIGFTTPKDIAVAHFDIYKKVGLK
jgi:Polysaccharide biosynthesis enzyme WcbI